MRSFRRRRYSRIFRRRGRRSYRRKLYRRRRYARRFRKRSRYTRKRKSDGFQVFSAWVSRDSGNFSIPAATTVAVTPFNAQISEMAATYPGRMDQFRPMGHEWKFTAMKLVIRCGLTDGSRSVVQHAPGLAGSMPSRNIQDPINHPIMFWMYTWKTDVSLMGLTWEQVRATRGVHYKPVGNNFCLILNVPLAGRLGIGVNIGNELRTFPSSSSRANPWWPTSLATNAPMLYGIEVGFYNPGGDDWSLYKITYQIFYKVAVRRLKTGVRPTMFNTTDRNA